MDFTKENFDLLLSESEKLKGENSNKEKALQEERSKRKELRDKLDSMESDGNKELEELRNEKKAREEAEAKKKGKYEDLLTQKDKELEETKAKISSVEEKATKYDTFLAKQLDEKITQIPEEKKEFVNKLLSWKSSEEQLELMDGFISEFWKPKDFKAVPKDWGKWVNSDTTKFEEAKKSGNISDMIANAPRISEE